MTQKQGYLVFNQIFMIQILDLNFRVPVQWINKIAVNRCVELASEGPSFAGQRRAHDEKIKQNKTAIFEGSRKHLYIFLLPAN